LEFAPGVADDGGDALFSAHLEQMFAGAAVAS
jgi:hypothetical protein